MNPLTLMANAATRSLAAMFPGHFGTAKHNHYADFGFPQNPQFDQFYAMYRRNSLARAAVNKTIQKSWQDTPFLQEKQRDAGGEVKETAIEKAIRERFSDLRVWQQLAEADRRSMVGKYSGVILRLADNKRFIDPVDTVPGGLLGLAEIIPAWERQLKVSEWDTDETSEGYGHPKMFQFQESAVDEGKAQPRSFQIHPDRVVIWSDDGTVNCSSAIEPGLNDLMTIEKIVGGGGEGFWKNAKASPVLEIDKDAKIESMAKAMGVPVDEVADKMDEQVKDWQRGFDSMLMLQGMKAVAPQITLPSPEHFFSIAVQSFAASFLMPVKILVGMQTGERASTEDAQEWAQTNKARRADRVIPNIMAMVRRFERFGMLPVKDWFLSWTDLTETSMGEKIERADKMADVNQKMKDSGEIVFTHEEIRAAVDLEPLSEAEKYLGAAADDDDAAAALGAPQSKDDAE